MSLQHVFLAYNEDKMYTYVHYRDTIEGEELGIWIIVLFVIVSNFILPISPTGPSCVFAGNSKLPYGQKPLMLYNGEVSCQTLSGKVLTLKETWNN